MTSQLSETGSTRQWRQVRAAVLGEEPLCWQCGEPSTEVDHIIPRKHGGDDRRSNLRGSCRPCNLARGSGRWCAEPSREW
uniref:HNH endonuclease n=1 Tax=Streptomyces sp. NBC_00003 TaxID=2903608 RepID=A0AAU2V8K7_9ACTN